VAATKKKIKANAKAVLGRKRIRKDGENPLNDKVWDQASDPEILENEMLENSLPDYLQIRKRAFDERRQTLKEAGLQLPPDYGDVEFSDDEHLADLEERPDFPESVKPSNPYEDVPLPHSMGMIPASIAQYLRGYQIEGVSFLHELFVYQKGGILGDDMGLGKTVQVAAFLTAAFGKTGDFRDSKRMRKMRRSPAHPWYPKVLIVCPGTLIENWKQELERWGWWYVDAYHGSKKEEIFQTAKAGRLEIVITTYTTYKIHKSQLNLIEWDCVVADECHQLKERTSEITQAMNEINALCRIGLTGTAIQNKYEELWTLLNWTNPGRLGPLSTWKTRICKPLATGQSHDATVYQLSRARLTAKQLVRNLLPQFFLRRMKSLIAHQLPKKSDRVVFCPLTEIQRDAYERFLDSELVSIVRDSGDLCDCDKGRTEGAKKGWCCYKTVGGGNTKWQVLVFPIIAQLQKLSNHLALLIPSSTEPQDKQLRDLEFLQTMVPNKWKDLFSNRDSLVNLSNPEYCGKWRVLKKLLRFWHGNGDKVLVFSHSVKLLKMLQHLFHNTSYNVSYLDGSLSYEDRQKEVDDFNSDPNQFVFLISTKAGGVGLNITSANKVVIFDPNWNPSYDLQAQDRAYRIGQTRDVEVFRLVSAGTVEEIVYARQIYKQQQANIGYTASLERRYFKGIQNERNQQGELFGLQNLLSFHGDEVVLRDIVNKTNVAEAKAGVNLVNVEIDEVDDDNPLRVDDASEDAAISQLADQLAKDPSAKSFVKQKPKVDPVTAILASAGVEYTHENSEVIGTSKVEAQLSRNAEEVANDILHGETRLFDDSDDDILEYDGNGKLVGNFKYTYRPPEQVMQRQFCTMAKMWGFSSATEFALVVEGWTQAQRRDCLERFYRLRKGMVNAGRDAAADEEIGGNGLEQHNQQEDNKMDDNVKDAAAPAVELADKIDDDDDEDDEL
jgi:SNF2 family DNA or RNA helicase